MLLGDRFKALRESKGYTYQHLAELLGLSTMQIWRYEAGKSDATGDVLSRMARVFDVSVDYLLGLTDVPNPPGLSETVLTEKERDVLAAMRQGQSLEAIKLIVSEN